MEPERIAVPTGTLRLMLARCRAGIEPRIPWSESRDQMIRAAMEARRDALQEIAAELEELLPDLKP